MEALYFHLVAAGGVFLLIYCTLTIVLKLKKRQLAQQEEHSSARRPVRAVCTPSFSAAMSDDEKSTLVAGEGRRRPDDEEGPQEEMLVGAGGAKVDEEDSVNDDEDEKSTLVGGEGRGSKTPADGSGSSQSGSLVFQLKSYLGFGVKPLRPSRRYQQRDPRNADERRRHAQHMMEEDVETGTLVTALCLEYQAHDSLARALIRCGADASDIASLVHPAAPEEWASRDGESVVSLGPLEHHKARIDEKALERARWLARQGQRRTAVVAGTLFVHVRLLTSDVAPTREMRTMPDVELPVDTDGVRGSLGACCRRSSLLASPCCRLPAACGHHTTPTPRRVPHHLHLLPSAALSSLRRAFPLPLPPSLAIYHSHASSHALTLFCCGCGPRRELARGHQRRRHP